MQNQEKTANIIDSIFIPTHPYIMTEIRQATQDLGKIAQIINKDPGISSRILKTINSPFYGLNNKVHSLMHAISLLGLDAVMNIINSQLLLFSMKNITTTNKLNAFWNTSEDIAQSCGMISRLLGFGSPDEAYILGLFHNCAIPILLSRFNNYTEVIDTCYAQTELSYTHLENELIGTNHASIAYLISRTWHLPPHLRIAIQEHHNLEYLTFTSENETPLINQMLCILKISEHICQLHFHLGHNENDLEWHTIKPAVIDFIGISDTDYQELEDQVSKVIFST